MTRMGRAAVGKTLAAAIDAINHEKKPIRFTVNIIHAGRPGSARFAVSHSR